MAEPRVSSQMTPEWLTEGCLPTAGKMWSQRLLPAGLPSVLSGRVLKQVDTVCAMKSEGTLWGGAKKGAGAVVVPVR